MRPANIPVFDQYSKTGRHVPTDNPPLAQGNLRDKAVSNTECPELGQIPFFSLNMSRLSILKR
jgi:hypothetical protein